MKHSRGISNENASRGSIHKTQTPKNSPLEMRLKCQRINFVNVAEIKIDKNFHSFIIHDNFNFHQYTIIKIKKFDAYKYLSILEWFQ